MEDSGVAQVEAVTVTLRLIMTLIRAVQDWVSDAQRDGDGFGSVIGIRGGCNDNAAADDAGC